jgi:hypothetical protein
MEKWFTAIISLESGCADIFMRYFDFLIYLIILYNKIEMT